MTAGDFLGDLLMVLAAGLAGGGAIAFAALWASLRPRRGLPR